MLLAESCGLEIDEPVFESTPVLLGRPPRADRLRRRARDDLRPRPAGRRADVRGGGRLVSVWRGRFDLQPERDGMEGSARVVVEGDPTFETIVRGDLFLDTYPPTGARAMAAVRPLRRCRPGSIRSTSWPSDRSSASAVPVRHWPRPQTRDVG